MWKSFSYLIIKLLVDFCYMLRKTQFGHKGNKNLQNMQKKSQEYDF